MRSEVRIAVLLLCTLLSGCDRHVTAVRKMTWQCAPEHNMPDFPQAQTVRLFFLDNPHYQEEVSGKGLCDQLKASGRKVVDVEFDVSGNSRRGVHYYMESKIDGKNIVDIGGWGSSGSHSNGTQDPIGKSPLASAFEK